jgi:hypothetical protein
MIVRSSQNIRPPEQKPTAFGLALKEALERKANPKTRGE